MTNQQKLISQIKQLTEDNIMTLLDAVGLMLDAQSKPQNPNCPYCGSHNIIRYGHKCGKQRFLCKSCNRTFVPTTNTIMSHSHFPAEVWNEVIADTIHGNAIDYSAKRLGLYHQPVFDMRHKILLALQELPDIGDALLGGVSELDETFVLDCYKGRKLDAGAGRKARKHGAKAQKRGISNEYVCICAGIQRDGCAYAGTVNRAKPDAGELKQLFCGHIADGSLILCDGLRSYSVLSSFAECTIKDCSYPVEGEKGFFHLNTVNGFHSFIKHRYNFYRGVATKYLNRYNTLFASAYRDAETLIGLLKAALLGVSRTDRYHSNSDVRGMGLLAI